MTAGARTHDQDWYRAAKRARMLSWLSLVYMALEGAVALVAAIVAGSVALLGFGLDSVIEGLASVIIIWRFTGTRTLSPTAESRAQKAVAVTFFLLAPYIAYDAIATLAVGRHADTSWLGIGLAIASLIVMPLLGVAKKRLGARLDSHATSGEGIQNLLCAYLAAAVLLGLLVNTLLGWWWADPLIGLGIAALAIREGIESWRGEDCC
jgi:divalent metal cation (Fe/Co/Zn/Cd) transporter